MNVSIIGSGNVAISLARYFHSIPNIHVNGIHTRNDNEINLNIDRYKIIDIISQDTSIVIICVSDKAIELISQIIRLQNPDTIVVHTSGSTPAEVLSNHKYFGILYPLQSISKDSNLDFKEVPFFINANSKSTLKIIEDLCQSSKFESTILSDEKRKKLHLAAVISNNFCHHLLSKTKEYLEQENLDFEKLRPLMESTIDKFFDKNYDTKQTGPAVRKDFNTINEHLHLLKGQKGLEKLYAFMSNQIIDKNSQ